LTRKGSELARSLPRVSRAIVGPVCELISRGEFTISGFRNRDLRLQLFNDETTSRQEQRRHAAAVTRKLAMLRAHRLIRKVHGTHR
jgi:hypothetical protein